MTKPRTVRQRCDVCDAEAVYLATAVVVVGKVPPQGLVIGQCPGCKRFVCSDHAERAVCQLNADALALVRTTIAEIGFLPTVLCCPFHRRPLGQLFDSFRLLVTTEHKASDESRAFAEEYLGYPERFLRGLNGFDLRSLKPSPPEPTVWPTETSPYSTLLDAINAGTAAFERAKNGPASDDPSPHPGGAHLGEPDPTGPPTLAADPAAAKTASGFVASRSESGPPPSPT
jgi:hypothetical protein